MEEESSKYIKLIRYVSSLMVLVVIDLQPLGTGGGTGEAPSTTK
jgi:hypothetical protein